MSNSNHEETRRSRAGEQRTSGEGRSSSGGYPGYPGYPGGYGYGYGGDEGGGRFWEYLWIVRKRFWTVPALIVACVGVALFYSQGERPVYTARARLLVMLQAPYQSATGVSPVQSGIDLDTQIEILKSSALALRVVDKLKLNYDPDFLPDIAQRLRAAQGRVAGRAVPNPKPADAPEAGDKPRADPSAKAEPLISREAVVGQVLGALMVSRVRMSSLVDLSYTAPTPKLAADITNCVADAVIEMELERNIQSAQRAIDWLLDQQRQYQEGLLQSEKEIQALEKELGIVVARGAMQAKTLDFLQDQFGHLGSEVANASLERIQQSIRYKQLTTSLSSSREALELTPEVQTNAFLQSLFRDRTAKLREIEDLKKFAGPRNPDLVRLQNEVKRVDQSIDAEIAKIIKMVKAVGDAAADREQKFMEELEKVRAQVDKLNDKKWRYKKLRDDADQSNQLYDFLLKKAKETSLAAEVKTSNIQILSRAFPPAFRSRSSRDRRVKMSVLLGAALGVALAFALDYLDRSVKGAQDIERLLGLPVLAAINRFPGKHGRHAPPELIVANRPKSAFAEAFRTLRMRLSVGGRMEKALLITSAGPAEGKSTVAANLAVAMAETGKSVLLIDADIRKPSIRNVFELDPAKHPRDFVSYLRGEAPLEEVTVPVEGVRNLSLVPTMRSVSAAEVSHVMDPERVGKMLAAATAGFDRVIVDSPPMGAVGEPQMLASVIKSVVLVVRAGHTGRGMVQRAVDHLAEAGVAPAGIVLNFADVDRRGYYGYYPYRRGQYGRYYGYGYGYGGAYGGGDEATRDSAAPG